MKKAAANNSLCLLAKCVGLKRYCQAPSLICYPEMKSQASMSWDTFQDKRSSCFNDLKSNASFKLASTWMLCTAIRSNHGHSVDRKHLPEPKQGTFLLLLQASSVSVSQRVGELLKQSWGDLQNGWTAANYSFPFCYCAIKPQCWTQPHIYY